MVTLAYFKSSIGTIVESCVTDYFLLIQNTEKEETFQGFIKVTLNLVRPICMSLGARPPSIYELLTKEHIVEQNTQTISFYMPRDTVKSIHINR